ncbi:hypothetical protein GJAV_G00208950 [Gymnothorax javanicus]|nr:hypothetical protein GJAV_G00208950 [Gymnothorax javanicus]
MSRDNVRDFFFSPARCLLPAIIQCSAAASRATLSTAITNRRVPATGISGTHPRIIRTLFIFKRFVSYAL